MLDFAIKKNMKKLLYPLKWFLPLFVLLLVVAGCSTEDEPVPTGEYGYVQFHLTKEELKSGQVLDSLVDARQVEVFLLYDNKDIRQTVKLKGDEAYLTSEKLTLLVGDYVVKQYKLYDGFGNVLQTHEPEETVFKIEKHLISSFSITANAILRGTVDFVISKDYSLLKSSKAVVNQPIELYNAATQLNVTLLDPQGEILNLSRLKLKPEGEEGLLSTDTTLALVAGRYKFLNYTLKDKQGVTLAYESPESRFLDIEDFVQKVDTMPIQLARTEAIEDYYALKAIWDKMDGENWGWQDAYYYAPGTNWNFDKPVDQWGVQPGVFLHPNGRVLAMNLGAFNPQGAIPEELGQLTAMEALWCGASSDRAATTFSTKYSRPQPGERLATYKNWLANYYHTSEKYAANYKLIASLEEIKTYESVSYRDDFAPMNGITALPSSIGNLKELRALFVGNNHVSELPQELTNCDKLTDLVMYNLALKEFPQVIGELPNLIALGASFCDLNDANATVGLKALCNGPAAKTLQLLYIDNNNLETLPDEIRNLTNIGLFQVAYNRLSTIPAMGESVKPVVFTANNNRITHLPDDLINIIDIESFDVSFNQLVEVPRLFNRESYFTASAIMLNDNQIEEIPDDHPGFRTEELFLSNNKLTTVSEAITKSVINHLVIRNNRIEVLPNEIGEMRMLIALDLEGNRIKELPWTINVYTMPILKGLSLNFNQLDHVSSYLFEMPTLASLFISSQFDNEGKRTLKELHVDLVKAYGLRVLIASGNNLGSFPQLPYMLGYLDVRDNPFIQLEIPDYICERITEGTFRLVADEDQVITGCGF